MPLLPWARWYRPLASVDVLPLTVADLGTDLVWCDNEQPLLSAENYANTEYYWSTVDASGAIYVDNTDTYWVTASKICGSAQDEIYVYFEDCQYAICVPNCFTPDDDGINDAWCPETYFLNRYELNVFDRWGVLIFTSTIPGEY